MYPLHKRYREQKKKRNKIFLLKMFNCFLNQILSAANPLEGSLLYISQYVQTQIQLINEHFQSPKYESINSK